MAQHIACNIYSYVQNMHWERSCEQDSTQTENVGSMQGTLLSLMRWIGNYAWEKDCFPD